jgi:antitoxin component of MazEF toxin-antitoxin module
MALRIPRSFAEQTPIKLGRLVDLSIQDGKLTIEPISPKEHDLETLIAEVKENLHKEYFNDEPKGREPW